jgi:hypothetical protein
VAGSTAASEFVVEPDDLIVLADELTQDEFDDLLARPAAEVEIRHPDFDPADDDDAPGPEPLADDDIVEAVWLEEGVVAWVKKQFQDADHPRWPKGTPGGKGGEFMQVGERFIHNGKPYEITAFQNGKVYAHLATGAANDVHLLSLTPKKVGGKTQLDVKPAPPAKVADGRSQHSADVPGTASSSTRSWTRRRTTRRIEEADRGSRCLGRRAGSGSGRSIRSASIVLDGAVRRVEFRTSRRS